MEKIKKLWVFLMIVFAFLSYSLIKIGVDTGIVVFMVCFIAVDSLALYFLCRKYYPDYKAVSVQLLDETEKFRKQAEKTGYTVHYTKGTPISEHYEYKDVMCGYECTFLVEYENGKKRKVKCTKNDKVYQRLCRVENYKQ